MSSIVEARKSSCMYCGSSSFGKSCSYSTHGFHVHLDSGGRKCIYCGSTAKGATCPYNPFGKVHQTGIDYNPIIVEALENGIVQGIIMNKLSKPISETRAYNLGLIDAHGEVIRDPETLEEHKSLSGVDKYLIKVRNIVQEKLDILNLTLYYETNEEESLDDLEHLYPIELQCKDEVKECITKLISISREYGNRGITSTKLEKMIAEALLDGKRM